MISNTGISLHCLEKEFTFTESLQPSKCKPEYWLNLGSSKSRTKTQEVMSREIIGNILESCDERTAIAFTDSSCLGNPGPCVAGACIFLPGHTEPSLLSIPCPHMDPSVIFLQIGKTCEKSEKGRHLFNYRPQMEYRIKHKFDTRQGESVVAQLRTGYARLNEYLKKSNITESDMCKCGEIESVKHFLIECELYENEREQLRRKLFESCGTVHLDMNLLLNAKHDEEFKDEKCNPF